MATRNSSTRTLKKKPRIHPAALAAFGTHGSGKHAAAPCCPMRSASTRAYLEAYYGCPSCMWARS
jgi:hypothetical protein